MLLAPNNVTSHIAKVPLLALCMYISSENPIALNVSRLNLDAKFVYCDFFKLFEISTFSWSGNEIDIKVDN